MSSTQLAEAYLRILESDELPPGGVAFRKALGQARLDYTPDSLIRVDMLLRQIREKLKPRFDTFIAEPANLNFLYLLGFYVGTVVGRYTLQAVEWYAYPQLSEVLPAAELEKLPESLATAMACTYRRDGQLSACFFPLGAIADNIFLGEGARSVLENAEDFMRRALDVPVLRRGAAAPPPAGDAELAGAVRRLGLLAGAQAAWACRTALEGGHRLEPQLTAETEQGQRVIHSMPFDAFDEAIERYQATLSDPEPTSAGAVLAYDGYINLPRFRTDALVIEAHWYAPALKVQIAVPYRPAGHAAGFALHGPRLLESSLGDALLPALETAFFAGIDSFNPPGLWSERFVDEDDAANLAARIEEQVAAVRSASRLEPDGQGESLDAIRFGDIDIRACVAGLPPGEADYVDVPMPGWAQDDRLRGMFTPIPDLLREGRVVWAHLVQANKALFECGPEGHPGDVIYDPAGRLGPAALGEVAHRLFGLRAQIDELRTASPPQPEMLALAEHFENEMTRAVALPVPQQLSPAGLLISSLYFERKHLPTGLLTLPFFPLLISDREPGAVMVLPSRWWPQAVLARWTEVDRERRRAEWEQAWAKLAMARGQDDEQRLQARQAALENYALRGIDDGRIASLTNLGLPGFKPGCTPPPQEWEWQVPMDLAELAELYVDDVERARARRLALPVVPARLAFAARYLALTARLHSLMLCSRRACDPFHFKIFADDIQYAALGLVAGCEQPALRLTRLLCAAWEHPQAYHDLVRPEVRAVFMILAPLAEAPLRPLTPFREMPRLEALLADDLWRRAEAAKLAPLIEAACEEYAEYAPVGPFRGLPMALILMLRLRARAGLENPTLSHPLLAAPLGEWPEATGLDVAQDRLLKAVRARMAAHGYDEGAIEAAVVRQVELEVPVAAARPARSQGAGADRAARMAARILAEASTEGEGPSRAPLIGLIACLLAMAGCWRLMLTLVNGNRAVLAVLAFVMVLLGLVSLVCALIMVGRFWNRGGSS